MPKGFFLSFIPFLFLLSVSANAFSIETTDSLECRKKIALLRVELNSGLNSDQAKTDIYNDLAFYHIQLGEFDIASDQAGSAYKIADRIFYKEGLAKALCNKGLICELRGEMECASTFYIQEIKIAETFYAYEELIALYEKTNNALWHLGDYFTSMEICQKAMKQANKTKHKYDLARFTGLAGYILMELEEYEEANLKFTDYNLLAKAMQNKDLEIKSEIALGELKIRENDNFEARRHLRIAFSKLNQNEQQEKIKLIYSLISKSFKYQNYLDSARYFAEQSIYYCQISTCVPNPYDLAGYYINYSDIFFRLNIKDSALMNIWKGITLSKSINHKLHLMNAYYLLADNYNLLGKFDSAYFYLHEGILIEKEMKNAKSKYFILKMQAGADLQRAQNKYLESRKSADEFRQQKNLFLLISLTGFLITALIYTRYRFKKKSREATEKQKQVQELFKASVNAQDDERKRLAKDLHDGLGTLLSALKLNLETMDEEKLQLTESQKKKYKSSIELSNTSIKEMRHIAHSLMPASLSQFGLSAALRNLFDTISSSGALKITYQETGLKNRLKEEMEISLYYVILEIINNAVKYAEAKSVTVQLMNYNGNLNIIIEDDGKGFIYNKNSAMKGIGLKNIFTRVKLLRGTVEIDTSPGRGTIYIIDIPIESKK